jgi:hypothetical protein
MPQPLRVLALVCINTQFGVAVSPAAWLAVLFEKGRQPNLSDGTMEEEPPDACSPSIFLREEGGETAFHLLLRFLRLLFAQCASNAVGL